MRKDGLGIVIVQLLVCCRLKDVISALFGETVTAGGRTAAGAPLTDRPIAVPAVMLGAGLENLLLPE